VFPPSHLIPYIFCEEIRNECEDYLSCCLEHMILWVFANRCISFDRHVIARRTPALPLYEIKRSFHLPSQEISIADTLHEHAPLSWCTRDISRSSESIVRARIFPLCNFPLGALGQCSQANFSSYIKRR